MLYILPFILRLQAKIEGNALYLQLRDTGPGFSPQDLEHLFERFYRGDKSLSQQKGTAYYQEAY
ncbi:MAG: ATP-binding protein [Firmicutes bacterium]|nr:ATP-binding protein [Bacillota bacterium]